MWGDTLKSQRCVNWHFCRWNQVFCSDKVAKSWKLLLSGPGLSCMWRRFFPTHRCFWIFSAGDSLGPLQDRLSKNILSQDFVFPIFWSFFRKTWRKQKTFSKVCKISWNTITVTSLPHGLQAWPSFEHNNKGGHENNLYFRIQNFYMH